MFKLLKYLVILIVVLVIGAAVAAYLSLGYVVKQVVQKEGTAQLNVPTTLGSAHLGLTSGSIGLTDLAIGSPAGFTAPQMLSVGSLKVDTAGITHLRDKPLHVTDIQVDAPKLVVEQHGMKLNFKELMDNLPGKSPATGEPKPSPSTANQNPTKLVIDTLAITNATVQFIPDAAGVADNALGGLGDVGKLAAKQADKQLGKSIKPTTVTLPSLTVRNIGNADGKMQGAEIKDVATAVITAMAQSAAKSANLPFDPALLNGNLDSVKGKAGDEIQQQLKKLPGGAGGLLNGVLGGSKGQ